nr:uncharacterized protein LOC105095975 [Camelus dromedarius]
MPPPPLLTLIEAGPRTASRASEDARNRSRSLGAAAPRAPAPIKAPVGVARAPRPHSAAPRPCAPGGFPDPLGALGTSGGSAGRRRAPVYLDRAVQKKQRELWNQTDVVSTYSADAYQLSAMSGGHSSSLWRAHMVRDRGLQPTAPEKLKPFPNKNMKDLEGCSRSRRHDLLTAGCELKCVCLHGLAELSESSVERQWVTLE